MAIERFLGGNRSTGTSVFKQRGLHRRFTNQTGGVAFTSRHPEDMQSVSFMNSHAGVPNIGSRSSVSSLTLDPAQWSAPSSKFSPAPRFVSFVAPVALVIFSPCIKTNLGVDESVVAHQNTKANEMLFWSTPETNKQKPPVKCPSELQSLDI